MLGKESFKKLQKSFEKVNEKINLLTNKFGQFSKSNEILKKSFSKLPEIITKTSATLNIFSSTLDRLTSKTKGYIALASPAHVNRLNFSMDRLKATIGYKLIPFSERLITIFDKLSVFIAGLNPKIIQFVVVGGILLTSIAALMTAFRGLKILFGSLFQSDEKDKKGKGKKDKNKDKDKEKDKNKNKDKSESKSAPTGNKAIIKAINDAAARIVNAILGKGDVEQEKKKKKKKDKTPEAPKGKSGSGFLGKVGKLLGPLQSIFSTILKIIPYVGTLITVLLILAPILDALVGDGSILNLVLNEFSGVIQLVADLIMEFNQQVFSALKPSIDNIINAVLILINSGLVKLFEVANQLIPTLVVIAQVISTAFINGILGLLPIIQQGITLFSRSFLQLLGILVPIINIMANFIPIWFSLYKLVFVLGELLLSILLPVINILTIILQAAAGVIELIVNNLANFITILAEGLVSIIQKGIKYVNQFRNAILEFIASLVDALPAVVKRKLGLNSQTIRSMKANLNEQQEEKVTPDINLNKQKDFDTSPKNPANVSTSTGSISDLHAKAMQNAFALGGGASIEEKTLKATENTQSNTEKSSVALTKLTEQNSNLVGETNKILNENLQRLNFNSEMILSKIQDFSNIFLNEMFRSKMNRI